jgi:flagellar FliL protein
MAAAKESEKEEAKPDGAAEGEQPKKKMAGKKLVLFIVAPLLLLGGGGGAAAYFMGFFGKKADQTAEDEKEKEKKKPPKPMVFYNLPDLLVNLSGQGRRSNFLKLAVSLELEDAGDITKIEAVLPRVIDAFQSYLRELRPEDLRGSAGLYRVREELLARVNTSVQPAKVSDVLFKEMLIQ